MIKVQVRTHDGAIQAIVEGNTYQKVVALIRQLRVQDEVIGNYYHIAPEEDRDEYKAELTGIPVFTTQDEEE